MSALAPKWEAAWHPGKKRYFYQDRVTGKSSWSRPSGCTIQLPTRKPADAEFEQPNPPADVPNGWTVAFSWDHKSYFYYKIENPEERSWFRPQPIVGWVPDQEPKGDRAASPTAVKKPGDKGHFFAGNAWDAESFRYRIQEAHAGKDHHILRDILTEVVDSNSRLLSGRLSLPVPKTQGVRWLECMRALQEQKIEDYGNDPKISVSCSTVAEAVAFFGGQDPRRVVCCINEADGIKAGGGYRIGERGLEEDLCRRIPALYESLHEHEDTLYPFGPSTCHKSDVPNKYADVLFTPRATLSRGSEDDGFPIWPTDKRVQVSVISLSPPNVRLRGEIATMELLSSSIMAIYVAPVYKEPRCTTLILSTWGCHNGVKEEDMMTYIIKALQGELPGIPIKLGRLYHEVHFAVPPPHLHSHSDGKDLLDTFKGVLKNERVPFTEL